MMQTVIKPCHIFTHHGRHYIINIEKMSACAIDDEKAGLIKEIISNPVSHPDPHMEEELKKLELLSEDRGSQKKKEESERIPVVNVSLFLTQHCNLKCIYCYGVGGEYGTGGNMEEKTAFQAVDWMVEQSGEFEKLSLGFFGGEPFLKFPLMKAVVEYAGKRVAGTEKYFSFRVTTNGTVLDDEIIAFIKDHEINLTVSFDGTKELQDRQRPYSDGRGSYDSTLPKIKKLLELLPETPGHSIIVGDTDPQIVKQAMKEIGFSQVTVTLASKSLFAEEQDKAKQIRDTEHIMKDMEEEAGKWITLIKKRDIEGLKYLKTRSSLHPVIMQLLHNSKRYHNCGAGLGLAAVSCSGDVYLCHRFVGIDEYKLGNVFNKDLKREEYQNSPVTVNKKCYSCFAKYYCAGGCKHDNVVSCGSISAPSEDICRIRRRELELSATVACSLAPDDSAFLVEEDIFPPKPCPFDF